MFKVRTKLESTYDDIWDTPHSFQYLARSPFPFPFHLIHFNLIQHRFEKLSKALPIGAMDTKYKRMIATFKGEMERIARYMLPLRFLMNIFEGCSSGSKSDAPFRGTIQRHQVTDLQKFHKAVT